MSKGEKALGRKLRQKLRQLGRKVIIEVLAAIPSDLLGKAESDDNARIASDAAQRAADNLEWDILINATQEEIEAVTIDGLKQAFLRLGISDRDITDQVFEEAREWAKDRAAEMVGMRYNDDGDLEPNPDAEYNITESARDDIQSKVTRAIDEGWSSDDLADEIESVGSFSPERALMIARTEIIRANNEGHMIAFRESGVVQMKEWSTAEDGDVCDICTENEEQGPIPLDDVFLSGDDAAPAHPNCRCVIVAVIADEAPEIDSQGGA